MLETLAPIAVSRGSGMLWRVSLFAGILSAAGLPLYIHLPVFALRHLGLDLATVGLVLLGLRAMDFIQDPLLGRLVDRFAHRAGLLAALALAGMAAGFFLLFAVAPPVSPVLWLVMTLVVVFTSYSLASILFYAKGVALAERAGGHLRVAGYRESGLLGGVLIATVAPSLFTLVLPNPYAGFGVLLALLCLIGIPLSRPLWPGTTARIPAQSIRSVLTPAIRRFLLIGLVNTLPVAFTSTLFLLFVEYRLQLAAWSGLFLLLFFLAAGIAAPVWTALATRYGARPVLLSAMTLAILSFAGASQLDAGDAIAFAAICVLSGATMSADIVILPALFAQNLSGKAGVAGIGFGLWNFVTKLALALAAGSLILTDALGFAPGSTGSLPDPAFLAIAYAVVPLVLKCLAVALVFTLPSSEAPA